MPELIYEHNKQVQKAGGPIYDVLVFGEQRDYEKWEGWIEFHPVTGGAPVLRTERETSQPDRDALAYWASGLESAYIEGAFDRARQAARATVR